ncbi:nitroreductase family protein [Marinoscillum furvescens]|uniref:Nitroreductase n=1 Tax=Marinoscillum furvescens DSM 4134 TaxID=1122208 RepID=A0A3D9L0S1_MARFU|nr:nitroreductase family protein [Marinoscillum furvescens]RED97056.1 nitroreductase [Marinoscillum furvescens DSM 4134]
MDTLISKEAKTEATLIHAIKDRWSPRAFAAKPIGDEELQNMLEAARWAPSSMNEQPWRFIYAHKGEPAHQQIVDTLMSGNQTWAQHAPLLIVTIIKTTFDRNGAPNRSAQHDLGLAIGNLTIQGTADGLSFHHMGGVHFDQLAEAFAITDGYEPVTVIAAGYQGDPDTLTDELKSRELAPRKRLTVDEFAGHGKFIR